jgi:hypothetical protein
LLYFVPLGVIHAQLEIPQNDTSLLRAKYKIMEDGVSIGVEVAPRKVYYTTHGGEIQIHDAVESYNHGKMRGNTILVTGDRPVFGMMRVYPEPSSSPDRIKLGDGRIRISLGDRSIWLDEFETIRTEFHPSFTSYELRTPELPGVSLQLTVSQAGEWGCVVMLKGKGDPGSGPLQADLRYGGLLRTGNRPTANYFLYDPDDGRTNRITLHQDHCILDGTEQRVFDRVMIIPGQPCRMSVVRDKVVLSGELNLDTGSSGLSFVIGHAEHLPDIHGTMLDAIPHLLFEEARDHFEEMISRYSISTPCSYLDAGFRNAVVNFDYVWGGNAWLEGVHWWTAPWTNLFQISAGISLDQMERTRTTLQTYNVKGMGPAPVIPANGIPAYNPPITEDGLLYYCYQIWQFYQHTGDLDFVRSIWPGLFGSIVTMYERRDPDGDGLLSWREGCNPYLYQADHLGLPNAGSSPSIMAAGLIPKMASLGEILGETGDAGVLKELVGRTNRNLLQLWNKEKGCFYNQIDHQALKHMVHYYTDLVFPALYSGLDEEYSWQSLNYLRNSLLLDAKLYEPRMDLLLCRVGDFQPFLFSTCNVMPTQMAETARALFKTGDVDRAYELMKSVAVTGTIYTEAPGNFPEAMGLEGKGEGQFIFGNPIGSFLYTLVDGLFGLRLEEGGKTLNWSPAFPFDWPDAKLRMPYGEIDYEATRTPAGKRLVYRADHSRSRKLTFSTWIKPGIIKEVRVNGMTAEYRIEPGLNAMKVSLEAETGSSHRIEILYEESNVTHEGQDKIFAGHRGEISFSHEISRVSDPQGLFGKISVSGRQLRYTAGSKPGSHTAFVYLKDLQAAVPVEMEILPLFEVHADSSFYDRADKTIQIPLKYRISDNVTAEFALLDRTSKEKWQSNGLEEKSGVIRFRGGQDWMPEGNYAFRVTLQRNNRIVYDSLYNVHLGGDDGSREKMARLRNGSTRHIDLSSLYNAEKPGVWGPWNGDDETILLSCLQDENGIMETPAGNFRFPVQDPHFMIVQAGKSDHYTQLPQPVPYPEKTTVPVKEQGYMLSLFYHSEIKYRHTFERLGSLTLSYTDGTEQVIPLVAGRNMKPVYKHAASETLAVEPCSAPRGGMMLNILRIGLENKTLDSFTIHLPVVDAQFGLVAASISSLETK